MSGSRGTIFSEEAGVAIHEHCPGEQRVLRLRAPEIARRACPGQFVHIQCDPAVPMRRPMSIMRADPNEGHIDILFKVHGAGTGHLASKRPEDSVSLLGPIGVPFKLRDYRPRPLLIGGGVGIPPMVFLASRLKRSGRALAPFLVMGSEVPFPFQPRPSQFLVAGIPAEVIAAMPLMEDWGLASRLASLRGFSGCFEGTAPALAGRWLAALERDQRAEVEIFACGPTAMLKAVAALARDYGLPCQVSLEEYMACAVGGCAGCTVPIETGRGLAMKRVCVDGPVFEASTVVF